MTVRQMLEKHRRIVLVASVLAIAVAVYAIYQQTAGTYAGTGQPGFFSDDDGKTWFTMGVGKVPPFDHNGRTAVRCYLYQCGSDKFVAYLERYKPEYQQQAAKLAEAAKTTPLNKLRGMTAELHALGQTCREVKKPGEKNWITASDPAFKNIVIPQCKDGSGADYVYP